MKAALVVSAVFAAALPAATAVTIYQDDFLSALTPAGTDLHGAAPDTRVASAGGSASAVWTANSIIDFNGTGGVSLAAAGTNTGRAAYLPFSPQSGYLYDYRVSVAFAAELGETRSLQMGFFGNSPTVTTTLTGSAGNGPLIFMRNSTGVYIARAAGNADLPGFSGSVGATEVDAVHVFRITIDTSQPAWVMRTYMDGVEFGSGYQFPTNPTITAVGFSANTSNSDNAAGTFSDFILTATAIPEPSALALLAAASVIPALRRTRKSH